MEKIVSKVLASFLLLLFISCDFKESSDIVVYYDFYQNDTLRYERAATVNYKKVKNDNYDSVVVNLQSNTTRIAYNQRVTEEGIFRSLTSINFLLSHSFLHNKEVELKLAEPIPYFLNVLTRRYSSKSFLTAEQDSTEVIFFDEAIPWYSYTCSYYLKEYNLFLLLYNPRDNSYFKISHVEGLNVKKDFLNSLSTQVISDTSFFARYYKLPEVFPPPPK